MAEVLDRLQNGPVEGELVRSNGSVYVDLAVTLEGVHWNGVASFPGILEDYAKSRLGKIESLQDVEDLIRAWSSAETWADFQAFRNSIEA